jgi:hypothetical protein
LGHKPVLKQRCPQKNSEKCGWKTEEKTKDNKDING